MLDEWRQRPEDRAALRAAALALAWQGLQPLDIAQALKLTEATVRQLLADASRGRDAA
jgi:DNA-directed RNA polymerase specialized sigma24 family protein